MDEVNKKKWDNYYINAKQSCAPPPWEAAEPFTGLVEYVQEETRLGRCIEFGSGSSCSSIYLAEQGFTVDAVDICAMAIERASILPNAHLVNWIQADLLSDDLLDTVISENCYDLVFDMQCFHVLRLIDERKAATNISRALKPSGKVVVVVGAALPDDTRSISADGKDSQGRPGPPLLTLDQLRLPLEQAGLTTIQLSLSRFNSTPTYANLPGGLAPLAWMGVFQKIVWNADERYALEVQAPFSTYILEGKKCIETRAYALPPALLHRPIYLLESQPGTDGVSSVDNFIPAQVAAGHTWIGNSESTGGTCSNVRIIGTVVFTSCTQYTSQAQFDADRSKHLVPVGSVYDYSINTNTHRFEQNINDIKTHPIISMKDGKVKELFAWEVGFYEAKVYDVFPALERVHRSLFKVLDEN